MPKSRYICTQCGGEFYRYKSTVRNENMVFCSRKCQGDYYKEYLRGVANPNYKDGLCCTPSYCECGREKDFRADKCSVCTGTGFPIGEKHGGYSKNNISYDDIRNAILSSSSYSGAAHLLGISRQYLMRFIDNMDDKIDISHFVACSHRPTDDSDVFCKNSNVSRGIVRTRAIQKSLIEYVCSSCGIIQEWNGKLLTLELHHINGDSHDNRPENLTWLCPNCHSQSETHKGKNTRRDRRNQNG